LVYEADAYSFVLILCTDEPVGKILLLLKTQLINESTYWYGTHKISNCLNRLLSEVLGCVLAIIMTIFFCKVKIFPLLEELPQRIIPYFIRE
jgi:hypothetical protein